MRLAGLISGTSVDAIDVAIVDIQGRQINTLAHGAVPYPAPLRARILAASNANTHTAEISRLNFEVGERFAAAFLRICAKHKIPTQSVQLIGSHGQTIYHEHRRNGLQIGEGAIIAERTGIPVVSDFRPADIAAGGAGAPLVPFLDYRVFRHPRRTRVALNLGGIANITVIPPNAAPDQVLAFDTGPANMIVDALVTRMTSGKQLYDRKGAIAAAGQIHRDLLGRLLRDPYYRRKPPKSVGREQYGVEFVDSLVATGLSLTDLIATATAFTASTVAVAVNQHAGVGPCDLIASGGGVHNPTLLSQIQSLLPQATLATASDFGIDSDAKEAIAFALMAHETWHRRPSNIPSATGARHSAILGKLSL
ncbi:MAG TPA: anhydro-N-acetylmuramic acid kinase [Bryobacteraceae bacterium]|jgi:anhydro-N-acetylmuramic acid kinase